MSGRKEIIKSSGIGEQYIRVKHPSGCTICLYPMEGFSSAYALFGASYGSVDTTFKTDGDEDFVTVPEGIAHYLEHKLFENDECDAFELYAKTGANANAFTSFDKTAYLFSCSQKFEENLEILLNFVQEPYFTDETVQKEQGIIGQEIMMYRDDPGWRVFFNCLQAVYHNNPVRIDIAGTAESIARIDKDLLYRCYNAFYNLNNTVLSIAGNFDVDKALEICDRLLKISPDRGLEKLVPEEPREVKEKTVKIKLSCSQPMFNIMYKLPPMTEKEAARAYIVYNNMFETCLGRTSSFYTEMYEQGLIDGSFGVGVFYGRGFFVGNIDGDSKDPELLLNKINAELKRLKTELPDRREYENIKKRTYGELLSGYGSVETVANTVMSAEMAGLSAFELIDIAAKIAYEDIVEALMALDVDNCSISIVEPI
ncbi:MAG: insulinase family protein [Bacteroides sp.]|nr:insulinase family protein [Bacteroides sp.]